MRTATVTTSAVCLDCSAPLRHSHNAHGSHYFDCSGCAKRFKQPVDGGELQRVRARLANPRRLSRTLTDEEITYVLTSWHITHYDMARELRVSRELIRIIRNGQAHTDRCPDLERWPTYTERPCCSRCVNWNPLPLESPSCGFGFPDPIEENTYFARECIHYKPA